MIEHELVILTQNKQIASLMQYFY